VRGVHKNRARGLPRETGCSFCSTRDWCARLPLAEHAIYRFANRRGDRADAKYLAPKDARKALLVGAGAVGRSPPGDRRRAPITKLTTGSTLSARALARELGGCRVQHHRRAEPRQAPPHHRDRHGQARRDQGCVGPKVPTSPRREPAARKSSSSNPQLLLKADKLIADRVFRPGYGNLHHAIAAGVLRAEKVYGELGTSRRDVSGDARTRRDRCRPEGVGVQDARHRSHRHRDFGAMTTKEQQKRRPRHPRAARRQEVASYPRGPEEVRGASTHSRGDAGLPHPARIRARRALESRDGLSPNA